MVDWVVEMPLMLLAAQISSVSHHGRKDLAFNSPCRKMRAHMLKTMHVVRFQPRACSGPDPGCRSLAGEASRAVTELDSERSRGVSSATVSDVAELSWS
jgi:hypothetical protein